MQSVAQVKSIAELVEPRYSSDRLKAARVAAAGDIDDSVDGLGDERPRRCHGNLEDELLQAQKSAFGGPRVNGRNAARMPGPPGFQKVNRFTAAHFPDDDPIGSHPKRR